MLSLDTIYSPLNFTLLHTIFYQYLMSSFCLTIVSEGAIDFNFNTSFIFVTPKDNIDALTKQLLEVSEMGCSDYIVKMKEPKNFMIAFHAVSKLGNIRRSDRKIIFLPSTEASSNIEQYVELFSMKESSFVANILAISSFIESEPNCEVFDLITHEFLTTEGDQMLHLDQWSSCTQSFKKNVNLFPHDITNLRGRIMKVACFTYKPYSLLDLDPSLEITGRDGMEIRIVDEFCRWVNCTIEVVNEDEGQWGEILPNGTGIGVIGSVAEDRADLGISALYSWYEEFIHLDFSAAGIRSAVTCVAPSPRLISSWTMPLMPFSLSMWYAVIVTFILVCISLAFANRCSSDNVLLTVFGIMIAQSQNLGASWRMRGVIGWLLVAALVLVNAYGAGLASTFTVPKYEASIDTIQDLVDRNMEWGATHDAWIFSITLSTEPLIMQLVSQFKITPAQELKRRSFTRDMAFSIEKLPAGYFAIGDYITKEALYELTVMLENFYYEQCVVMLRKSSPFTEKLSAFIGRLHQSGLMLAWETQVALKYLNFEVQQEVKLSRIKNDVTIKPLTWSNVVGVFILYASGVVTAFLIFLCEIIFHKFHNRNTVHNGSLF